MDDRLDPVTDEPRRRDLPERLLRLLALLQSRRTWSAAELAERLSVTERTVRRDIDRLRALDYSVTGTTGPTGGYQLAAGTSIPPLVLTDDEVIALAVRLATATTDGISGVDDASLQALAKLEQILPARLRPQLTAVSGATSAAPWHDGVHAGHVDPGTLAVLAACSREHEVVRFDYLDRNGHRTRRRVEPNSIVSLRSLWYLVAHDQDRDAWRIFRIDRISAPSRTYRPAQRRNLPAPDAATFVTNSLAAASYRYTAHLTVSMSATDVRGGIFGPIPGDIQDLGPGRCRVRLTAESPALVTQYAALVAALGADFTLKAPAEITDQLHRLGEQLRQPPTL